MGTSSAGSPVALSTPATCASRSPASSGALCAELRPQSLVHRAFRAARIFAALELERIFVVHPFRTLPVGDILGCLLVCVHFIVALLFLFDIELTLVSQAKNVCSICFKNNDCLIQ